MIRILLAALLPAAALARTPADLRAMASSYYEWRDSMYPVASSDLTHPVRMFDDDASLKKAGVR